MSGASLASVGALRRPRSRSVWPFALAPLIVGATFIGLGLHLASLAALGVVPFGDVLLALAWLAVPLIGVVILHRQPGNRVGSLLAAMGLFGSLGLAASAWAVFSLRSHPGTGPGGTVAAWLASWLFVPAIGLLPFVIATFPTGSIESLELRRSSSIAGGALVVMSVAQAVATDAMDGVPDGFAPIANPLGWNRVEGAVAPVTTVAAAVLVLFTLWAVGDLAVRYRRSAGILRLQLRWVAAAFIVLPVSFVVGVPLGAVSIAASDAVLLGGQVLFLVSLAGALGVAVLRHRLYDLGLVVNRSFLYSGVMLSALGLYGSAVWLTGALLSRGGPLPALVGAATVAVAFHPIQVRMRIWADHRLYGRRRDPYGLVREIGAQLEGLGPDAVPDVVVSTLGRELRLPWVALEGPDGTVVGRHGSPVEVTEQFRLHHQGRSVGALAVGARPGTGGFSDEERSLFAELGRQIGTTWMAGLATAQLRDARERLVLAREEERRRIRRDLHDGLGPTLAALTLQADVARSLVRSDADAAEEHMALVSSRLQSSLDDVRRLVRGLRPPAIDELGLPGALEELVGTFDSGGRDTTAIALDIDPQLPDLPAAVEVAVYRIAAEALSNAVRHTEARRCTLRCRRDGDGLVLEVTDDGHGIASVPAEGEGLRSMRERAVELGGSLDVRRRATGGTSVVARLPVRT